MAFLSRDMQSKLPEVLQAAGVLIVGILQLMYFAYAVSKMQKTGCYKGVLFLGESCGKGGMALAIVSLLLGLATYARR